MFDMRRREFVTLLGGAAAAWPLAARAQQPGGMRRTVLMNSTATDATWQSYVAGFVEALRQLGWSEGQNLRLDLRIDSASANALGRAGSITVAVQLSPIWPAR